MKTLKMMGILGAFFSLSLVAAGTKDFQAGPQKTAENLYQEALLKIDGDGDLLGAIKLFQKILSDFSQNRAVAGKAQFQIDLCYEKLGLAEAEKAYREVIEKFADQVDLVKRAKERLALFSTSGAHPPDKTGNLILREVDYPWGEPSPDGRWILYGDEVNGLFLYEIATGTKTSLVTLKKGGPAFIIPYLLGSWWSPSGNGIAYILWTYNAQKLWVQELWVIDKAGTNPRCLLSDPKKTIETITGWTPDEQHIFVSLICEDRTLSFGKISVADGSLMESKMPDEADTVTAKLSPNGNYLAYNVHREKDPDNWDIQLSSFDGSPEKDLIKHFANDKLIGWTPDNHFILFQSDRNGSEAIWIQKVSKGNREGEPRFIRTISGSFALLGFTKNGAFHFSETQGGRDVWIAQIDFETGKTLAGPMKVEKKYNGMTSTPFWSKDGKYLGYYFKKDLKPVRFDSSGDYQLRIRNMEDNQDREFSLDPPPYSYPTPQWSSDGKSLFLASRKKDTTSLMRLNPQTGQYDLISQGKAYDAVSPDGAYLYRINVTRTQKASERETWINRKNVATGQEQEVFRLKPGNGYATFYLSPDGQRIALSLLESGDDGNTTRVKFLIMPAEGGEVREIHRTTDRTGARIFWGPTGKDIFYITVTDPDKAMISQSSRIWRISVFESKPPRKFDLEVFGLTVLALSPDGKHLAYLSNEPAVSKIWIMENYIPKELK